MTKSDKSNSFDHPILLFDGVCNLCDGFVQWVIRRDAKGLFRFASLQSDIGQGLLKKYNLETNLSTVVLIDQKKAYTHSDVALEIVRKIGGLWSILYIFKIVPPFIRNAIYDWIAKNRYSWFGQKESCMIPTPELQSRFLG